MVGVGGSCFVLTTTELGFIQTLKAIFPATYKLVFICPFFRIAEFECMGLQANPMLKGANNSPYPAFFLHSNGINMI